MDFKKSLLNCTIVELRPHFSVKIPTVGEILEDEAAYYRMVSSNWSFRFMPVPICLCCLAV